MQAFVDQRIPRNLTELRSFLDMLNFYISKVSSQPLLHPLLELLREGHRWHWNKECECAFQSAKETLVQAPVLEHYDPDLPLVLAADASAYGIGAVASHFLPDGLEQPIEYASPDPDQK